MNPTESLIAAYKDYTGITSGVYPKWPALEGKVRWRKFMEF